MQVSLCTFNQIGYVKQRKTTRTELLEFEISEALFYNAPSGNELIVLTLNLAVLSSHATICVCFVSVS